jgi:hypothetical protein
VIPHRLRHPTSGLGQEPSRNIVGFPFYRGRIADEPMRRKGDGRDAAEVR